MTQILAETIKTKYLQFFVFFFVKMWLTVVHTAFRNTLETVDDSMKTTKYSFYKKKKQEVQFRLHSHAASVVS